MYALELSCRGVTEFILIEKENIYIYQINPQNPTISGALLPSPFDRSGIKQRCHEVRKSNIGKQEFILLTEKGYARQTSKHEVTKFFFCAKTGGKMYWRPFVLSSLKIFGHYSNSEHCCLQCICIYVMFKVYRYTSVFLFIYRQGLCIHSFPFTSLDEEILLKGSLLSKEMNLLLVELILSFKVHSY